MEDRQIIKNERRAKIKIFLEELDQDHRDVELLRTTVVASVESLKEGTDSLKEQILLEKALIFEAKEEINASGAETAQTRFLYWS